MSDLYATDYQFKKVILRMMPSWAKAVPEHKLIVAILEQAWIDGNFIATRRFFDNDNGHLERYCTAIGLDWEAVSELYKKHNRLANEDGWLH